ncbi:hypothetical protein J7E71_20395 [Mesobacillus foraminis]|uniref:hypothetical protein n=1 Tax=Mesobacillus foraminis TaxID=279826 RepID=UPI001BE92F88|nr:hypothetical protein [Mesobacillus foraminis]MBT2758230.1 hypothetical protein [Mesobacillus foraminis]
MIFIIYLAVIGVVIYSCGFALSLWKQKNKPGAVVVVLMSMLALALPYLTYVK